MIAQARLLPRIAFLHDSCRSNHSMMSRHSQYVHFYLWQTTQRLTTSVFHLSQGHLVQFRGDTIVRTSVMRAIRSQEKLAIVEAAGAMLTVVGRDMHSTMAISGTRLQVRENHQMTKKNSFRTNLLPTLDKRSCRRRKFADEKPTSRELLWFAELNVHDAGAIGTEVQGFIV